MPSKRDNEYYKQRIKKDRPDVYRDLLAGKIPNVKRARELAGLITPRTRLHELTNAWSKASAAERKAFLAWLRPRLAGRVKLPAKRSAFGPDGQMLDWAKRRVRQIMNTRKMTSGTLSRELGLSAHDTSVLSALREDIVIRTSTAAAVEVWLAKNSAV